MLSKVPATSPEPLRNRKRPCLPVPEKLSKKILDELDG